MTAGGGNDTAFLAPLVKRVYAFDISEEAINKAKKKCASFENVVFIHDDHIHVREYVKDEVKLVLFNLGYYPYGDHEIVTEKEKTLRALEESYDLLCDNGYLIVTSYRGHPGGKDEYEGIRRYIEENELTVLETYRRYRKSDEPVTFIVKKITRKPL